MDYDENVYQAILDILEEREGMVTSTAQIVDEIKQDDSAPEIHASKINEPIEHLILLGEITLVWAQQAGRVVLNKSVHPGSGEQATLVNGVWRCYIAKNHQERYHSGLFESRSAAKEYLRKGVGDEIDKLTAVPFCNNVLTTEIDGFEGYGTHTVVIRGEQIHYEHPLED